VTDSVELKIDEQEIPMSLYVGAMYEAGAELEAGTHEYSIDRNGSEAESGTVSVTEAGTVYFRYTPFQKTKVVNSVANADKFISPATFVGAFTAELNGLVSGNTITRETVVSGNAVYETVVEGGVEFTDWNPADSTGNLDYIGGGIYKRTFDINHPSDKDITFEYKIALGGTWDVNIGVGGQFGANYEGTIHAGATSFTVLADAYNMEADLVDSTQTFEVHQDNSDALTFPQQDLKVTLIGSMTGWSDDDSKTFTKISPGLYALTTKMQQGDYSYKCKVNGTWFQHLRYGNASNINDGNYTLNLTGDTIVTFVYDAVNQELYDSINDENALNKLLNFKKPIELSDINKLKDELDETTYTGNDLGATYTAAKTTFKVWAPSASDVTLNLYENGAKDEGAAYATREMTKNTGNGVWSVSVNEDLKGKFYTYSVTVDGKTNETVDIYAKAVGLDGNRGAIVDLAETNPDGFADDQHVTQEKITDAVIWEVHVEDFSSASNSGISEENRGKYLAFTERGTTLNNEGEVATGVDYLKDLGVNYVHLLPTQDADNDEVNGGFNWNYNPKNYNVPEGKYSSDPTDPNTRISEFKQMVQGLHDAEIGVVMDVVYNHTSKAADSWFNVTVPYYYYRFDEDGKFANGSGCGNETASERVMFRKYMVDSILYWATEYHVDGFRFDLMGLHDVETMNAIRKALDDAGLEDVILYGEPWDAGSNALTGSDLPASKANVKYLSDGIAVFNDDIRDAVRGHIFTKTGKGFAQGGNGAENETAHTYSDSDLIASIQANTNTEAADAARYATTAWAVTPADSVTYASSHDDWTLWDRLVYTTISSPQDNYKFGNADVIKMNKIAAATILTSQGLTFFQAGEEFARTKNGDENSYESSIAVNQLDWSRVVSFEGLNHYYKGLIELRKAYAPFRDSTNATINKMAFSDDQTENLVAYTIQNPNRQKDIWDTVAVILNSSDAEQQVALRVAEGSVPTSWVVVVNGDQAGTKQLATMEGSTVTVPAKSALVLVDQDSFSRVENHEDLPGEEGNSDGSETNPGSESGTEQGITPGTEQETTPGTEQGGKTTPVKVAVTKVTLKGDSKKIAAGKKLTLKATVTPANATDSSVTWKSSNIKYAKVSNKGVVTTLKAGAGKKVTITATANDGSGKKATYKITIMKKPVKKIKLKASKTTVKAGKKVTIKATVTPSNKKTTNTALTWKSSNTKYATVSKKGVVTTRKAGRGKKVTITATATDGSKKKATIKIKITK